MNSPEKFWDFLAKNFDKNENQFEKTHVKTIEKTKKYLNSNDIILDYGCATGSKTLEIACNVKRTYGIDISSKMILAAKRKAVEHKIENVDFIHTTLFNDALKKESFDKVLGFNILHLLGDNQKVVQRISELVKPEGLFISITPCLGEKMNFKNSFLFAFFNVLEWIGIIPQQVKKFNIADLEDLIKHENLQIVETEKLYDGITGYFIAAKKV